MALLANRDRGSPPARGRVTRAVTAPFRLLWRALRAVGRGLRRAGRFADGPIAVALFVAATAGSTAAAGDPAPFVRTAVIALQVLPLAVLRARPVIAWATMSAGAALGLLTLATYPTISLLALLVAVGVVAARVERRALVQVGAVTSLALLPAAWHPRFGPGGLTLLLLGVAVALAFGDVQRRRREAEAGQAEAQERGLLLAERTRIARELHDVVAHHLSLIAVQSQSAPRRITGLPPDGAADFAAINAASREALNELRRLLSVLRDEDAAADRAPQPGVAALPALVGEVERAGLTADLEVVGRPRALLPAVDVSAYRIVQEALTNVRRHAQATNAHVTVEYRRDGLRLRVADDGSGPPPDQPAGHGLVGIRERVAMLGGEVALGAGPDGGFLVDAALPYEPPR